jgi:signal transduction histidine kinase
VTDDGVGFDPDQVSRGLGLGGMADRLEAIGGRLDVRSSPGAGTTIAGVVPIRST